MRGFYLAKIYFDNADRVFYVDFPDFKEDGEKITYGEDIPDALYMAWDVLNLMLCDYEGEPPLMSLPPEMTSNEKEIISLVWYDTDAYKKYLHALKSEAV